MEDKKTVGRSRSTFGDGGRHFFLTERDVLILRFIWRWKHASTATIHEVLGRPHSEYSTYKALERLNRLNFVETAESFEHRFLSWQLTDKGFRAIRGGLGELCEEGFLTEHHWHDRNVLAFQLGEWATHNFPFVTHFTEQEMRRRSVDQYPPWVPQIGGHRSDGCTRIQINNKTVVLAYEVELWPKSLTIYESVFKYYKSLREYQRIYWLIGEPYVKEQLIHAKTCAKEDSSNYHVFVDLHEYMACGWDARVTNERSQTLFTIRQNMQEICGEPYRDYMGNKWGQSRVTVHYDTRKVLGKKKTYA